MEEILKNFLDSFSKNTKESGADRELAEKIKKDLLSMLPKIKKYFSEYDEKSVMHQLEWYAHARHRFTKSADYYARQAEDIQLEYRKDADKRLRQIQHKKLFNLQCRWRAGQLQLEGIETTYDFYPWQNDLYNCPFLPPITQAEVDLMIRFLKETPAEYEDDFFDYDWQNYPYLKICYAEEEEIEPEEFYQTYACAIIFDKGIPPWYDFYDLYMGTTGLLALPDIKFPKEMYYIRLYYAEKEKQKKNEAKKAGKKIEEPKIAERKPWLGLDDDFTQQDFFKELVENFETKENKKLFANYAIAEFRSSEEDDALQEETQNVLAYLEDAREPVPIEAHEDYRKALIIAYRRYKAKKIIEAIPAAFEDYCMKLDTGIGFPSPEQRGEPEHRWGMPQGMLDSKKEILEGRKLCGEPPDYNY
ncbi:MAG: hypothetical protein HY063_04175 [Bacteroidetes bacterium]|nr:hypothetical protein [Bacteroidota bacterium]